MRASWPEFRAELAADETVEVVVQVNGKVRAKMMVAAGEAEQAVLAKAKAEGKVSAELNGKQIVKSVVVPNKLVNFVVR